MVATCPSCFVHPGASARQTRLPCPWAVDTSLVQSRDKRVHSAVPLASTGASADSMWTGEPSSLPGAHWPWWAASWWDPAGQGAPASLKQPRGGVRKGLNSDPTSWEQGLCDRHPRRGCPQQAPGSLPPSPGTRSEALSLSEKGMENCCQECRAGACSPTSQRGKGKLVTRGSAEGTKPPAHIRGCLGRSHSPA